jgi:hypothetical protein
MMRPRQVSVIGMLSLLASAATASAECAWVLWSDHYPLSAKLEPVQWKRYFVYPTYSACWDKITELTAGQVLQPGTWADTIQRQLGNGQYRSGAFASRVGDKVVVDLNGQRTHWTCYPDSVDPREPKEK